MFNKLGAENWVLNRSAIYTNLYLAISHLIYIGKADDDMRITSTMLDKELFSNNEETAKTMNRVMILAAQSIMKDRAMAAV